MRLASYTMALVLAGTSLALPQTACSADVFKSSPNHSFKDIALRTDGVLMGYVVDLQGEAVAGTKVTVHHDGNVIAETISNHDGEFIVRKLRGGVHQVVAGENSTIVRFWTRQAAPPASRSSLTIVAADKGPVRGQDDSGFFGFGGDSLGRTLGAVALGGAIAGVVWAVDDANEGDTPASP